MAGFTGLLGSALSQLGRILLGSAPSSDVAVPEPEPDLDDALAELHVVMHGDVQAVQMFADVGLVRMRSEVHLQFPEEVDTVVMRPDPALQLP